ncbi:VOC family protein [Dysgonomonas sp. Marseille-P4677]|uniref:VOC family protein n=1 Tax=Dysgonomonas sp. Marseille-P4677 TaxID=2364790 RepID=UPI001911969F|nr:VOC family protein [Dysgonomonas sp. Marseille-P4677]MBK5722977.1 VOC family protein [Dysgonomonas sp. Marseille-P4677]
MATVNVYLMFNGNCEEAFNFYKSVFGGEFTYITRYSEMPPQEDLPPLADEDTNKIMHMSLPISKETMLMGSDNVKEYEAQTTFGNNFSILATATSREEADRLFNALSADGQIWSPMKEEFFGEYIGMLADKFGINWMVNYPLSE